MLGTRRGEDLRHAPLLHHAAALEHRDVVADLLDHVHGVGDYHQGHAGLAVDVAQQLEDGVRAAGIERGGRLVAEDHLGLAGERAGDGNALLLPAGELAGIALRLLRKTNAVEQLESTGAVCLRHLAGGGEEREADVVQHGLLRQQAKVLEDHRHATAIRAKLLARKRGDVTAIDLDDARRGRSSRLMVRTSVDLPAPLIPMMPKTSPSAISRLMSESASRPRHTFCTHA